ncbi:hypothetical protein SAMN05216391_11335 [Lachnospiraceae bacterium KHCPX20]|nr:hypothetical protein SAMN05216391_11335 [Lachnospiraceae bacterium KHCPX20]
MFFRSFTEDFYTKILTNFDDDYIADYVNKKSKELRLKERALKDSLQLLTRIFDFAIKREHIIKDNPASRIDLQNYFQNCDTVKKSSDEKIFTTAEIEMIKERIRFEYPTRQFDLIGHAILLSILTGVRVAEIPPLRWLDVTDKGLHIHRQQRISKKKGYRQVIEELPYTKNERRRPKGGRYFPITNEIQKILNEIKAIQSEIIFNLISFSVMKMVHG